MAQLFFKYGAMNSGKTIEILKVAHNYEEQDKTVLIFTSAVDDRDKIGVVASRIGIKRAAIPVYSETDMYAIVEGQTTTPFCVLVDESQFLQKKHVLQLANVVDKLHIPVMAFGLKNDFSNELFEGSKYLLLYADKIEEIKTICWYCHKKAIMNMRLVNGKPVYQGEQIQIGGNEAYIPVCRNHYFHPPLK